MISVSVSHEQNSGQLTLICPCPSSCLYSGSACASKNEMKVFLKLPVQEQCEQEKRQKR
jgi:hypothetical protein